MAFYNNDANIDDVLNMERMQNIDKIKEWKSIYQVKEFNDWDSNITDVYSLYQISKKKIFIEMNINNKRFVLKFVNILSLYLDVKIFISCWFLVAFILLIII